MPTPSQATRALVAQRQRGRRDRARAALRRAADATERAREHIGQLPGATDRLIYDAVEHLAEAMRQLHPYVDD